MCEEELFKHQYKMFNLLKAYKVTWELHQQQPQNRSHVLELRRLLRSVREVDGKQKQLVQQVRLKRLYEQQQQRDRNSSSLPSSPQACSPCSSSSSSSSSSSHRNTSEDDPPSPRLRSPLPTDSHTPSLEGDAANKRRCPPPPAFLEPDNLYLWEAEQEQIAHETDLGDGSVYSAPTDDTPGDSSNDIDTAAMEEDALCEVEQPWGLATEEEFLQYFGMLPSRHLQEVQEKRALRRQANRHRLFFAMGAAERRDAKRKKKYLAADTEPLAPPSRGCSPPSEGASGGEGDASRPGTPVDEVAQRLLLAPRNTCSSCGTNEDVGSSCTQQCGGCGEWYHPGCSTVADSPVAIVGEEWLCGGCHRRGIRASVVHDVLLLRSLRLANERRVRDGRNSQRKGDSRARKASSVRRTATAAEKKSSEKRREAETPVDASLPLPPPPPPPASTPVPTPVSGPASSMKTRGSANRRPPAKYLSPPSEAPATARQLRPVNQLTLATKSVKVSLPVNRSGASYPSGVGAAAKGANSKAGQGSLSKTSASSVSGRSFEASISSKDVTGSRSVADTVRISKSARINLTKISANSVKNESSVTPCAVRLTTCKLGPSPGLEGADQAGGSVPVPVIKTRNVSSRNKIAIGSSSTKKTIGKDTSLVKVFRKILHNKSGL